LPVNYYYVWGAMLECCQRCTPKLTNITELKHCFADNWNVLPQEFVDKLINAIMSLLQQTLIVRCCNWCTLTLFNAELALGN